MGSQSNKGNLLLDKLPASAARLLEPHLLKVYLQHGDPIITPDVPIRDVYFPVNCLLSLVTILSDGAMVESGTIGREGMSGVPVLLDARQTTMETLAQIPGEAYKIRADILKELYDQRGELHGLLNRYIHTVMVVGSQSTACNARHPLEQRFCRWLLMSSDGVGSDEVNLTQEYLSVMLGVRRPGVSNAAVKYQSLGLIDYRRGWIKLLDRQALEDAACECYHRTKEEYNRLFGE